MPALSKPRTPCIAQLAAELRFASKPTLLRHLRRIDGLGPQIEPAGVYPEDWIVFRVTGYRPDIDRAALVPGEALRADLSALAEAISEGAGLRVEDLPEGHETIGSLAARWGVSRKTIERYRRRGLIGRRVDLGGGRRAVVFLRSGVEWFEAMHGERLGRARAFGRIAPSELARMERWAQRYRARLGWSRSKTASRLAERTGHSHEGVRRALLRIDRSREQPIFPEPGPATGREQLVAERALRRGIEPSVIAQRTGRSIEAVHRAINAARRDLLVELGLPSSGFDEGRLREAMESAPVQDARRPEPERDLAALVMQMRRREPVVAYEERMRALAAMMLTRRAGRGVERLSKASPPASALDAIETDLRLVSILRQLLLSARLPLVLSTIEARLGGTIDTLPPDRAAHLIAGGIRAAAGAIARFEPTHGGRLAAPVGLAVTRFAARQADVAQPTVPGKASRRIAPGYTVAAWTTLAAEWEQRLGPDPRWDAVLHRLGQRQRRVLELRFALSGRHPVTRTRLAEELGTTTIHAARFERQAVREARALTRDRGP